MSRSAERELRGLSIERLVTPPESWFWRIAIGILLPIPFLLSGLDSIRAEEGVLHGRRGSSIELFGTDAVMMGVGLIGIAAALHFHGIWCAFCRIYFVHQIGRVAGLLCLLVGFGYLIVNRFFQ